MRQFRDQIIENETIVLKNSDMNYLGPNLQLKSCKIKIDTASKGLVISRTKFSSCEIILSKKTINLDWMEAILEGCRFKGTLDSHDFGHTEDTPNPCGSIKDCNFEEAVLNDCRFFDCDVTSIKFPVWPCFTILNVMDHLPEMKASSLIFLNELALDYEFIGSEPVAVTHNASSFAQQNQLSLEQILFEISGKDWIVVKN